MLVNEHGSQLHVELFNNVAESFDGQDKVVAIISGRVNIYKDEISVLASLDSSIDYDLDVPEAENLKVRNDIHPEQ